VVKLKTRKGYLHQAKKRWGRESAWITGEGKYALLAHCRILTVTLHETKESAEKSKRFIDKFACGGLCYRAHEIIEL